MERIAVNRFRPRIGTIEWGNPDSRGLSSISIEIPLESFDSGLSYIDQPESTRILLYEFSLPVPDPYSAEGHTFDLSRVEQGGSVCIGHRHNPVDIQQMTIRHSGANRFKADLELFIDFEHEGVGQNETVRIVAELQYNGKVEPGGSANSPSARG